MQRVNIEINGVNNEYQLISINPNFGLIQDQDGNRLMIYNTGPEWKLTKFEYPHKITFIKPPLNDLTQCNAQYSRYKQTCGNLWDLQITSGHTKEYYRKILYDLKNCLYGRLAYTVNCYGSIDSSHQAAIDKMRLKIMLCKFYLAYDDVDWNNIQVTSILARNQDIVNSYTRLGVKDLVELILRYPINVVYQKYSEILNIDDPIGKQELIAILIKLIVIDS